MAPFGFIDDGIGVEQSFVDDNGDFWKQEDPNRGADEYGDRSYMWDYLS